MDRAGWKPFLRRWSEEWLSAREPGTPRPFEEPITAPRLGFPPATEDEVAAAEARLGCALPPSLREFLLVSNGWQDLGDFVCSLRAADELGWVRDLEPHWIDAYEDEAIERSLLVSLEADSAIVFLDPMDVDERGEWAAYWLASWSGSGPERHGSFFELMYDLYARFHALHRPSSPTSREWDAKIERARQAALAGEIDGPLATLAEAGRFGRDRAWVLRFQMLVMLRRPDAPMEIRLPLSRPAEPAWSVDDALLMAEILPVLHAAHERTPAGTLSMLSFLTDYGSDHVRRLIMDYQARAAEPGFRVRLGPPDFESAVRAAVTAPDPSPALHEALGSWRPLNDDHIAPISLLADPRIAPLITPDLGRRILATPRGRDGRPIAG
ncbi:SMI1/KNR4 family protein [Spongiactinospora rosea]|uniref:SMI1/KNR4 family protein n=1 Tax=Spongiactinospora rosea TaxID=2248750 RepID=UPI001313FA24|nr:SMI1/KNR4 family protein [Spongiactinospora rosea]